MTINQIEPAIGQYYRQRRDGRVAMLRAFRRMETGKLATPWTPNTVRLMADNGWVWSGCEEDFWAEWIHADAFNEEVN